jgi:hypothetical protein
VVVVVVVVVLVVVVVVVDNSYLLPGYPRVFWGARNGLQFQCLVGGHQGVHQDTRRVLRPTRFVV